MPSARARPFPDPPGITPIAACSSKAITDATSLIVPSPPHATTSRAPRAAAALASSRAWPVRSVTNTSARSPWRSTTVAASSARARARSGPAPPAIGLMMMEIDRTLFQREPQRGAVAEIGQLEDVECDSRDAITQRDVFADLHQEHLAGRGHDRG